MFREFPEARDSKIPDSVFTNAMEKGIPLMYAYAHYANKNASQIAEQKALKGIQQNSQSSSVVL